MSENKESMVFCRQHRGLKAVSNCLYIRISTHRYLGQTILRFSRWLRPVPNLTDPASHRHLSLHDVGDPRMRQHSSRCRASLMVNNQTAANVDTTIRNRRLDKSLRLSNKIFHLITPYNVVTFLIGQLRWLENNSHVSKI